MTSYTLSRYSMSTTMQQLGLPHSGLRALRARSQPCLLCKHRLSSSTRTFQTSSRRGFADPADRGPFRTRLRTALRNTRMQWYTIPASLGIGFLGGFQFYKTSQRERERIEEEDAEAEKTGRPPRRKRVRPSGPWAVQISYYLPLKAMSRAWGWFNELTIPYYLRVPGFKLYSYVFGVNLSEVEEDDLHTYPNLASFFYRRLKPGVRPLDPRAHALLSPADGKVLRFGMIDNGEIDQIKGMTYSLEALLGSASPSISGEPEDVDTDDSSVERHQDSESDEATRADEEFANVNGISYTTTNVQTGNKARKDQPKEKRVVYDASMKSKSSSIAEVRADLALSRAQQTNWWPFGQAREPTALYYCVIYLAPGDYHRFHSPAPWIVEKRRHFAGELYSVSPYLQRTLPGLFTLNERVALIGRWRWGFFSYTPVGATNVGSIVVNFDSELRTNSLTTDTAADRAAEEAGQRGEQYLGYAEATYKAASTVLGGHALRRGEEMGGFQLGSSIVLVFEAPKGRRPSLDEGWDGKSLKGGWKWGISGGQKVKVGEALGWVEEE